MFLVTHSAVALLATRWTNNPAIAFGVGLLSHFVMDALPHGDEGLVYAIRRDRRREIAWFTLVMIIDLLLLGLGFAWMVTHAGFRLAEAFAIAGACLPDFMWGFEKVIGRRVFGLFSVFHDRCHNVKKIVIPSWYGLPLQLALAAGLWYLLGR